MSLQHPHTLPFRMLKQKTAPSAPTPPANQDFACVFQGIFRRDQSFFSSLAPCFFLLSAIVDTSVSLLPILPPSSVSLRSLRLYLAKLRRCSDPPCVSQQIGANRIPVSRSVFRGTRTSETNERRTSNFAGALWPDVSYMLLGFSEANWLR